MSSSSIYFSALTSGDSGLQYQCNRDLNIYEFAWKDVLVTSERGIQNFRKIQKLNHNNLLEILDVFREKNQVCVLYRNHPDGLHFCPLSKALNLNYVMNMVRNERAETKEFIQCVMDSFTGLHELHLNGYYHGNLSLETTYIYWGTGSRRPVFQLSGYRYIEGGASKELIVKDYSDLADMFETLVKTLAKDSWLKTVKFVEVKEFCRSLKAGFSDKFVSVPQIIQGYKQFIIENPIVLLEKDRPEYILLATTYIKEYNIKCNYVDAVFKDQPLYCEKLGEWLNKWMEKKGSGVCVSEKGDPGKFLIDMVRNFLCHKRDNKRGHELTGIIGNSRILIDDYFREHHPNIVITLFNALKWTEFKFQSF